MRIDALTEEVDTFEIKKVSAFSVYDTKRFY